MTRANGTAPHNQHAAAPLSQQLHPVPARTPGGRRTPLQTRLTGMRTTLIAAAAALTVTVIFIIQNVHAANISFPGIHLVLPLAGALLLAAIAGSPLTVAAGPARITQLRQITRRGPPGPYRLADPDDRRPPCQHRPTTYPRARFRCHPRQHSTYPHVTD